jgi:hypothetical protein
MAPEDIAAMEKLAASEGVTVSAAQPLDSTSEPLNAPISAGDIIQAAHVLSAIFTTSSAALSFLDKLLKFVRESKRPVEIRRPGDRQPLLVRPDTDRKAIEEFCRRV